MTKQIQSPITWLQVNNLIPVITSVILIAISWANLSSRVELLNQKMDLILANQNQVINELTSSYKSLETRYGQHALEIKELQTRVNQ